LPEFNRTSRRFWNRVFRLTDADEQPGPILSRNIQLVSVVSDDSHLLRPVVNPGSISNSNVPSGGAGIFSGLRITAPASATLIVSEIANDSTTALVNISYTAPPGLVITGNHLHLVTPDNATLLAQQEEIESTGVVPVAIQLNAAPALGAISDQGVIIIDPGESLFIGSGSSNVILGVRYAFLEVG